MTWKAHVKKRKEKARSLVGTVMAAVDRRLKSIQLQGEVFVSEIIARKWQVNEKQMLLGVSLTGSSERADAVADRSFSAQAIQESLGAGSALGPELLPGRCGAFAPEGWECSRGRRERDLRLKTLHCTGTQHGRDTREPGYNRNTGQAARRASQQRKPSSWQQFTWAGFSGLWHFVSQCNFTRVCLCVCVCVSLQYKQKATRRRKLINFKIWNREQVNKIHGKMWLIVWIPYIKSQHIYHFSLSIKTSLMDKSSMRCISALVILNPMKTHLFTTERTIWRVEHAVSFKVCTVFKVLLTY